MIYHKTFKISLNISPFSLQREIDAFQIFENLISQPIIKHTNLKNFIIFLFFVSYKDLRLIYFRISPTKLR